MYGQGMEFQPNLNATRLILKFNCLLSPEIKCESVKAGWKPSWILDLSLHTSVKSMREGVVLQLFDA